MLNGVKRLRIDSAYWHHQTLSAAVPALITSWPVAAFGGGFESEKQPSSDTT